MASTPEPSTGSCCTHWPRRSQPRLWALRTHRGPESVQPQQAEESEDLEVPGGLEGNSGFVCVFCHQHVWSWPSSHPRPSPDLIPPSIQGRIKGCWSLGLVKSPRQPTISSCASDMAWLGSTSYWTCQVGKTRPTIDREDEESTLRPFLEWSWTWQQHPGV